MTTREKLIARIAAGDRSVNLAEVDALLIAEGFKVRKTTHTYLYSKSGHRLTVNAHNKVLHPKAVKELRNLLVELGLLS